MGNTWKGISEDALTNSMRALLGYSGLPLDEFEIKDVVIDE